MAIEIRRNKKTGELVKTFWICRKWVGGERKAFKLAPIKGKPPASWIPTVEKWDLADKGDKWFEESRADAEAAYAKLLENPPEPTEPPSEVDAFNKVYKQNHGKRFKAVKIKDILKVFDAKFAEAGDKVLDTQYAKWQKGIVERFITWWTNSGRSSKIALHDVTIEDGKDFFRYLGRADAFGNKITANTLRRMKSYLKRTFHNLCPYSTFNPFDVPLEANKDDETIHREALTQQEIDLVLETAEKEDPLLYELIATGLCTALRRKDICELRWTSITDKEWEYQGETKQGSIKVKTHKTGAPVEIPIFPLLGKVLAKRLTERRKRDVFVFPEAEELNRTKYKELTNRIKRIYALALAESKGATIEDAQIADEAIIPPNQALPYVTKALENAKLPPPTKARITTCMTLYAKGMTYRQITRQTGLNRSSISVALHKAETLSKTKFIPPHKKDPRKVSLQKLIKKVTMSERKIGMKAGSIYDFPCLRTTFVTLAAKNRVPLEQVRLITGHTDTRMIEQYYNRATGLDFAGTIAAAMPTAFMQEIPMPIALPNGEATLPALPNNKQARATAIDGLQKLLGSGTLTKAEKKKLLLSLMGDD